MVFTTNLLRRLHGRERALTSRKRPQTFRPQFEQLEPRQMLSASALISGAATAEAGKAYQLDLSNSVPVASWGIDWNNDSVIDETVAGTASSVSHVFTATGPVNISAVADGSPASVSLLGKSLGALPLSQAPQNPSESIVVGGFLYVADLQGDSVLRYDLANPSASPTTIVNSSNGLEGAYGLAVRHNVTTEHDELFVSGWNVQGAPATAKILTVDLTTLGVSVFADNADGLNGPTGMTFDTAGNLYVANWWTNEVLRFDANGNANPSSTNPGTAVFVSTAGGLNTPAGVAFDANGNLLVTSRNTGEVRQYDGDGAFVRVFTGNGRLVNPQGITKGPDGDIYVADITRGRVDYFDGATGQFLGTFETAANKVPVNVAFDLTTGYAYVATRGINSVLKYEGAFSDPAAGPLAVNVGPASVLVNQTTSGLQGENLPQQPTGREVAVDQYGNSVMVWSDLSNPANPRIMARRFDASGQPLGNEFQVNTVVTSNAGSSLPFHAAVAMAPTGEFVVVYSGDGHTLPGNDSSGIFAQRFNADGSKNGGEFLVNTATSTEENDQAVAYGANGTFIVTWTGKTKSGNTFYNDVHAQRFNGATGQKVGSQINISVNHHNVLDSDVAIAPSGSFALTWRDESSLKLQRYNSSGVAQGSTITLTTAGQAPTLAYDSSGNLGVTYKVDSPVAGVYVRVFDPNGNTLLSQTQVDGGGIYSNTRPFIAVDKTNHFVISWMAQDGNLEGIYSRRLTNFSGGLDAIVAINTYTHGSQHGVTMAGTSTGGYVIMWKGEGDEDVNGVYARFFTGV